jgi:hypothetical protein
MDWDANLISMAVGKISTEINAIKILKIPALVCKLKIRKAFKMRMRKRMPTIYNTRLNMLP